MKTIKRFFIFSVLLPTFLVVMVGFAVAGSIDSDDDFGGMGMGVGAVGINLSDEVMAWKPLVEETAAEFGISAYVWHLLAIMQVESRGIGPDVMGRFGHVAYGVTPELSIRSGVRHFAELLQLGEQYGSDIETVVQAFNFGTSFLSFIHQNGGRYFFELAVLYAQERSDGVQVPYFHPNAVLVNGGWRYDFGNMFFVPHVTRYLAVAGVSGFLWPSPDSDLVTSPFGWRIHPIRRTNSFHGGIDINASFGTSVFASASGTVTVAAFHHSFGNYVMIDHGNGYVTLYAHNSRNLVRVGDRVGQGDTIALVGSTGDSTGAHIHFEIRYRGERVDPLLYFDPSQFRVR
ncbi:MAG: lysozyme family protein [Oscillospiraceae bacterium]|nr:lysozyme family protein [Oscillospiraceae bacterium]